MTRRHNARRGNLVVTAFMLIIAMMVIMGGIHAMLKQQLEASLTVQGISFARLQTYYLGEMGLNVMMFEANKAANHALPNPFPIARIVGASYTFDFSNNIALTRNAGNAGGAPAGSYARCAVTCTGTAANTASYRVVASLLHPPTTGNATPMTRQLDFTANYLTAKRIWSLTGFVVAP